MMKQMSGEQALALGAIQCGLKLATGYPGAPSTTVMDTLIKEAANHDYRVEWSTNEKVAVEVAVGASIAGHRSLVCIKNVGLNAAIDPLMALNITRIIGGMVLVIGDDPGAYGSQNDQDSRPLANFLEVPWFEPKDPKQAFELIQKSFSWSEKYEIPVFLRITRPFSLMHSSMMKIMGTQNPPTKFKEIAGDRFVPHPGNAVGKHQDLRKRLDLFSKDEEVVSFNIDGGKDTSSGIIAGGHCGEKLLEVIGRNLNIHDLSILFLTVVYPLPKRMILEFLQGKKEILILEEHQPVISQQIQAIGSALPHTIKFHDIATSGELFRWQIAEKIKSLFPRVNVNSKYVRENTANEKPIVHSHCTECRYDEVLNLIDSVAADDGKSPYYIGDPGCLVTVSDRLHVKLAMGGAVAITSGLSRFAAKNILPVALFGDSSFFHSTIPALCNAYQQEDDFLMVLLNNNVAMTTGSQPHPGTGRNTFGDTAPKLSMKHIAAECGVSGIFDFNIDDPKSDVLAKLKDAMSSKGLRMVICDIWLQ